MFAKNEYLSLQAPALRCVGNAPVTLFSEQRAPDCMQDPKWQYAVHAVTQIIHSFPCDAFIYGGANYKHSPNDLDIVIFGLPNALVPNLIAYIQSSMQGQNGQPITPYEKINGYQATILKSTWMGLDVDWNILPPSETMFTHASRLDFTIGALYYNLRTGYTESPFQQAFTNLYQRTLWTVNHPDVLFRKDPSVIFRMVRLLAKDPRFSASPDVMTSLNNLFSTGNLFVGKGAAIKPNRLYFEIDLLWHSGHAVANLNILAQLNVLEKVFPHLITLSAPQKRIAWLSMMKVAHMRDALTKHEQYPLSYLYCALHQHALDELSLDVNQMGSYDTLKQYFFENYRETTSIWHINARFFTNMADLLLHMKALKSLIESELAHECPSLPFTTEAIGSCVVEVGVQRPVVSGVTDVGVVATLEEEKARSGARIAKWLGNKLIKKASVQVQGESAMACEQQPVKSQKSSNSIPVKQKNRREILEEKYQLIVETEQWGDEHPRVNTKYQTLKEYCTDVINYIEQAKNNNTRYKKRPAAERLNEVILLSKAYCQRGIACYLLNNRDEASCQDDFNKSRSLAPHLPEVDLALWQIKRGIIRELVHGMMTSKQVRGCKRLVAAYEIYKKEAMVYYQEALKKDPIHPEIAIGLDQMRNFQHNYDVFLQKNGLKFTLDSKALLKKAQLCQEKKEWLNAVDSYEKIMAIPDPDGWILQDKKDAQMVLSWLYDTLIKALMAQPACAEFTQKLNEYYQKLISNIQKNINFNINGMANVTIIEDLLFKWGAACKRNGDNGNAKLKLEEAAAGYQRKHDYAKACECYLLMGELPNITSKESDDNNKKMSILKRLEKAHSSDALSTSAGKTSSHAEAQHAGLTLFKSASTPEMTTSNAKAPGAVM